MRGRTRKRAAQAPTPRGDAGAYDAIEAQRRDFFSLKNDKWPSYRLANEVHAEVFFKSLPWCDTKCLSRLRGEVEVREL